jgi:adenylate kinase
LEAGGCLIDWHDCIPFREDLIDLVVILRADTETHYDRLKARKYDQKKLDENVDCEIMQVILENAREVYPGEIIIELPSNTVEDMESNRERFKQWLAQWYKNNDEKKT